MFIFAYFSITIILAKNKTVLLKHNQHNNDDNEIVKECGEKV